MELLLEFIFKRKYLRVFLFVTLSTLFSEVLGQVDWTKYNGNPVLLPGASGSWDDVGFPNSSVMLIGSTYHMWYSGNDGTNFRIGHATSPDGINWTKDPANPVLNLGAPGSWDDYWVYFPTVVYDGAIYHMWYTGDDGPPAQNENVGHATSPDGTNWTKDPMNPVMMPGTSGSWDGVSIGGGFASIEGLTFHLWYDGSDGVAVRSGHATSTDGGTTWVKDPSNPILNIGSSTSWDYDRAQTSSIIYNPNTSTYYMFYCGGYFLSWKIGYATSPSINGPWTKNPNNPIFTTTPSGWDSYYVSFPCIIYDGNTNNYKMWYTGNNASGAGKIGLATSLVVPVELTSFTASADVKEVTLSWSTATELNNYGFEIQRKSLSGEFATVAFVKGQGTTTQKNEYSFLDKNLDEGRYFYRLKQMDYGGQFSCSQIVEVEIRMLDKFTLEQNYPNPFNPTTTIGFGIPEKGNIKLSVLNILGEEIRVLLNEEKEAGYHSVDFDASELPSGVYFYKLQAGNYINTKKMILLR
jgi:hypothetical protein